MGKSSKNVSAPVQPVKSGFQESIEKAEARVEHFFETEYKKIVIVPALIALVAFILIMVQYANTGDFINKGISLTGGTTLRVQTAQQINPTAWEEVLSAHFKGAEFAVRTLQGVGGKTQLEIETSLSQEQSSELLAFTETQLNQKLSKDQYSIETIGSSLSTSFFSEILKILAIGFVLMGIVVFIYFKVPIPSVAVMLSAFFDMLITLAIVNILGIKISTAGIAAFLMLIGYSIDTDTMLTARILNREPGTTVFQATKGAFKTGMTMTAAALAATIVAYVYTTSPVIKQITIILIIGLIIDVTTTWIQNAALLRWYFEGKHA